MIKLSFEKIERHNQHYFAHDLLANMLRKYGIEYENIRIAKGKYGKPYFIDYPNLKYNISHSDGVTACYVGRYEAGIDCEPVKKFRPKVVKRSFSESEQEYIDKSKNKALDFYKLWTLKESYVKAIGIGVSYPLNTVEFSNLDGEIKCNKPNCTFKQYIFQDRYIVSLCLLN